MPRAATSVATSTFIRPSRNSARVRVRTRWVLPPCSAAGAYADRGELLDQPVHAELGT